MPLYAADLGVTGLTDVGVTELAADKSEAVARTEDGVTELGTTGIYLRQFTPDADTDAIYWNSAAENTAARAIGSVERTEAIKAKTDLIDDGTVTVVNSAALDGDTLTLQAGDTLSWEINSLGDLTGYDDLVFVVKPPYATADDDSDAIIYLSKDLGLTVVRGAAYTGSNTDGSISVNSEALGNLLFTIADEASVLLRSVSGATWAVKALFADGTSTTLATGDAVILRPSIHTTAD